MTSTLTLEPKYLNVLQALGNIEETLEEAVRVYAIERLGERIGKLQHEILTFQSKYGVPYEKFYIQVTTDETFVRNLRQSFPTWERDFNAWEYNMEELHEWLGHLESISKE
jgi:predicted  nucleic acid-binding Zn-ribbon protein